MLRLAWQRAGKIINYNPSFVVDKAFLEGPVSVGVIKELTPGHHRPYHDTR